jgi:hypothetical protein
MPPKAFQIAVVRIETPPRYTFPDPAQTVAALAFVANQPGVRSLQIDFDARASERQFYRSILAGVARSGSKPVTITALASWCGRDRWLEAQPIAEAVPMYFRMGRDESKAMPVESPVCTGAIGLSMDEPWPGHRPAGLRSDSRFYLFNPRPWTREDLTEAEVRIGKWR